MTMPGDWYVAATFPLDYATVTPTDKGWEVSLNAGEQTLFPKERYMFVETAEGWDVYCEDHPGFT